MSHHQESAILNPSPEAQANAQVQLLVNKHRVEIDRIMCMPPEVQKKEFERYGVSPDMLVQHYDEFQQRSEQLRQKDDSARRVVSFASAIVATGAALSLFAVRKKISSGSLTQTAIIGLGGVASGLGASFLGTAFMLRPINQQSRELANDARRAFEMELAIAIENDAQKRMQQAPEENAGKFTGQLAQEQARLEHAGQGR